MISWLPTLAPNARKREVSVRTSTILLLKVLLSHQLVRRRELFYFWMVLLVLRTRANKW